MIYYDITIYMKADDKIEMDYKIESTSDTLEEAMAQVEREKKQPNYEGCRIAKITEEIVYRE